MRATVRALLAVGKQCCVWAEELAEAIEGPPPKSKRNTGKVFQLSIVLSTGADACGNRETLNNRSNNGRTMDHSSYRSDTFRPCLSTSVDAACRLVDGERVMQAG